MAVAPLPPSRAACVQVIPDQCKHRVRKDEIDILLQKKEDSTWTSLSKSSTETPTDFEYSWIDRKLKGVKIIPPVQDQHQKDTCLFHALSAATQMELKRKAALLNPPQSSNMKFAANDFASSFEKTEGRKQTSRKVSSFLEKKGY